MSLDMPDSHDEIAIIGMAGRFPGARSVEEFWGNLRDGVESITLFSDSELDRSVPNPEDLHDPDYVKAGALLDGVELFDASFFGLSAREAEITDPQRRLFLECAWEALEAAGHDSAQFGGTIAVFASATPNRYFMNNILRNPPILRSQDVYQLIIASGNDYLATRVSYALDLKGPSLSVQTACSSSLVAIHLARRSLLDRECDMALAGGVSIQVPQKAGYLYKPGGLVSPDGHTRAFDARAAGTLFGSGLGIVVLRRLADALADGDHIRAVIKGSAVNNDGASKTGYTAPSLAGQADVLAKALDAAGVDPETITFVEAHGTATATGDPVEVGALTEVFRRRTQKKGFCAIGTVKTNVGHLNAASGVAGVIKTILSLEHGQLPPSLHFERPNPAIDFPESPFHVNRALCEWESAGAPRLAVVTSLGIGGTNASAILEEAPREEPSGPSRPWQLVTLSARTPSALEAASERLASHLEQHPEASLADVAYTLKVGRRAFRHRRAAVGSSTAEAVEALRGRRPERVLTGTAEAKPSRVVFLFPGQGSEHVNMALGLYREEADFRETVDTCAELLKPRLGLDLRDIIYPPAGEEKAAWTQLQRPSMSQPSLFVVSYALARLLMKWGVRPDAVLGYSTGELPAACVAGVLSLEHALAIIAERGRLVESVPAGAMLAVALPEEELAPHLGAGLSLAVVGGPSHCVASGTPERVTALAKELKRLRVPCRRLPVARAFHSEMLDPILPGLGDAVAGGELSPPSIRFASSLLGTWAQGELADPTYWVRQMREPVRFSEAMGALSSDGSGILLEVGPGQALTDIVRRLPRRAGSPPLLSTCRHPQDPQSDGQFLLGSLGRLWLAGAPVDWSAFTARERRRRVPLPTYPFERRRYWVEPLARAELRRFYGTTPGKIPDVAEWFYVPSWKRLPLEPRAPSDQPAQAASWLIFADGCGLGEEMAASLEERGCGVTLAVPGQVAALFDDLSTRGRMPTDIVYLRAAGPPAASGAERFEDLQERGYYSLLSIAQALARQNATDPIRIHVVSSGMQAVTGEEPLCPESATLLGPCKVIPQEYPNVACRSIDVELAEPGTRSRRRLIEQLVAEVTSDAPDRVLAYRGEHRWVQTFEPIHIERRPLEKGLLRLGGVYLVTGGLGRIGLALAEHLSHAVGARLILTGRSGLPPRAGWPGWLSSHGPEDAVSQRIRKVRELEQAGAEVLVVPANVADAEQMRAAVARGRERFGAIHGVFHAAGIVEERTFTDIPRMGRRESEAHFEPKARGLFVLEEVLRDQPLDFCLLFSSISAILGGLGYSAYSAANAFMDAFVQKHNQAGGTPWVSVDWDTWKLREADGAAGADTAEFAMSREEGIEAFDSVLSARGIGQIVVSTGDLAGRIRKWVSRGSGPDGAAQEGARTSELHPRPDLLTAYVAPEDETQEAIARIWRELLGTEQVGIHDSFFELGGHSLLATQVVSRLRKALKVELPAGALFQAPTIAALATRVLQLRSAGVRPGDQARLLREIEDLSEEDAQQLLTGGGAGGTRPEAGGTRPQALPSDQEPRPQP